MKSIIRIGLTAALVAGGWAAAAVGGHASTATVCTPSWGSFGGTYEQAPGVTTSGQILLGAPDKSLSVSQVGITDCPGDTYTLNVFDWTLNSLGAPASARQLASVTVPLQTNAAGQSYVAYAWHLPDTATWGAAVCVSGTINQPDGTLVAGPADQPCTPLALNGGSSGGIGWH